MRRLEVYLKDNMKDVVGGNTKDFVKEELGIKLDVSRFIDVYNMDEELSNEEMEKLGEEVFSDSVTQEYAYKNPALEFAWRIEVGYLPGVTDNVGRTARQAIKDSLGKDVDVYHSRIYALSGELDENKCKKIAGLLHNPVVEKVVVHPPLQPAEPYIPKVQIEHVPNVETISLAGHSKNLEHLTKQRLLALTVEELKEVRKYLKKKRVQRERGEVGLDETVTDVELECIAQTWSEHCKHKIFNAKIEYKDNGDGHAIDSLFKTFIQGATEATKKPYIVSVFKDNGGIIKFNPEYDIAVKVETHNAPSALDPYGGALTGILGVQRDVLGTGLGAMPIANLDVLCFGPLEEKSVPKGVLHPKRIFEGVVKGIEDGGNKMGIPTVNGSIVFEKGYVARPLVYCGTVGLMPSFIEGRKTSEKTVKPGYLAVVVGGRIGKDGIHGATFSSQQIDEGVPQSVVQIGDPITQKKTLDFVLEARNMRAFEAITDNGAGGISSSIGELGRTSGGCKIELDKCPLKYSGLDPWEILVSESQERMTLVVPPEKMGILENLAKKHDVEISVVGEFTDTGKFHVTYDGRTVAYLDMDFLHEGLPEMKLKAEWKKKKFREPDITETDLGKVLKMLLSSPNVASKEGVIRRYDHEVKGMSVIKPIMKGIADAAVIRPLYHSEEGLVISHGLCPKVIQDSYDMAALSFDEAVRNAIAVGAKFGYLASLDNFSWPDPIQSSKTPDGEYKLGQLVRACIALYDVATAYGVPLVSGKDSMKNDYYAGNEKHSIPPTLLVTVVGKMDDIKKAMTAEFKSPGDNVYVVGKTYEEMGGSEYYKMFNGEGNDSPKVRTKETIPVYKAVSSAIEEGIVNSVHDVSDGGFAVALAECAFGGGYGVDADVQRMPKETENEDAILFSESAGRFVVSVSEENSPKFEKIMEKVPFAKIGRVRGDRRFIIRKGENSLVNEEVDNLKREFNSRRL